MANIPQRPLRKAFLQISERDGPLCSVSPTNSPGKSTARAEMEGPGQGRAASSGAKSTWRNPGPMLQGMQQAGWAPGGLPRSRADTGKQRSPVQTGVMQIWPLPPMSPPQKKVPLISSHSQAKLTMVWRYGPLSRKLWY